MFTLFHPHPLRVAGLLGREITARGWHLELADETPSQLRLFDSINRRLLSDGLVLIEENGQAQLCDAEGAIRWQGLLQADGDQTVTYAGDEQLAELISSRLEDWALVPVAELQTSRQTLCARLDAAKKGGGGGGEVLISLTQVSPHPPSGPVSDAALIDVSYHGEGDILARQLVSTLNDCGGISCPWPFMVMVQRTAAANGWVDSQRMWRAREQWADVVRVLAQLLRGIRDSADPAGVEEARTLLNHLRILIELGRKLQGKPAKSERLRGLKDLGKELAGLRSLDLLLKFLVRGSPALSEQWVGIPSVLASCPDWSEAQAAALMAEIELRRQAELERLCRENRYIANPDSVIEMSTSWPPFPRFEKDDSLVRGRWQANLESRIHKLVKTINLINGKSADADAWQDVHRRCRKIVRVMDACSEWAEHKELRFFRRSATVWQKRLGELGAMESNVRTLQAVATEAGNTEIGRIASRLAQAMQEWLVSVHAQLHRTLPALGLAARNARRKLVES